MQSSPLASHAVAVGIGAAISVLLRGGPVEPVCPACALSCGLISCPQVACTSGHIELSSVPLLILIGLIILFAFGIRGSVVGLQILAHQQRLWWMAGAPPSSPYHQHIDQLKGKYILCSTISLEKSYGISVWLFHMSLEGNG